MGELGVKDKTFANLSTLFVYKTYKTSEFVLTWYQSKKKKKKKTGHIEPFFILGDLVWTKL